MSNVVLTRLCPSNANTTWIGTPSTDEMKAVLTDLQTKLKVG